MKESEGGMEERGGRQRHGWESWKKKNSVAFFPGVLAFVNASVYPSIRMSAS